MNLTYRKISARHIFSLFFLVIVALIASACNARPTVTPTPNLEGTQMESGGMDMDMTGIPSVPAGIAFAEGVEVRFIHTEVSDPEIAKTLTEMMDSPVLVVPSLASAPDEMLANVYVFTNGVQGMGPLGYQPDIFDSPPGTPGYSPLRKIILVSWKEGSTPRELKSAAEVSQAEVDGEVALEQSGVVVNMPFITWDGGSR